MKKRILLLAPPGFGPVRNYRGEGVLLQLSRLDPAVEILFPRHDEPWKDLICCDIVYCFRSFEERYRQVAAQALDMGKKLWLDLDDNFFDVPPSNPSHSGIMAPAYQNLVHWFVDNADIVTVTTAELERVLGPDMRVKIVPNAIDDYTFREPRAVSAYGLQRAMPQRRTIHWRGGASHLEDLLVFSADFLKFFQKTGKSLHAHGFLPFFLPPDAVVHHPYVPQYYSYMENFWRSEPWAVIVPLVDNSFNRCKSNIAALEGIWAGAIPIVPNFQEWTIPGSSLLRPSAWAEDMEEVLELSPEEHRRRMEICRNWLIENRLLSTVNKKRIEIIDSLLS